MSAERRPRGIFITGTDTGVGKTLVGAALARYLSQRQLSVGVMKPLETGVSDPANLGPDAELLQWAADSADEPDLVSPQRFRQPLAQEAAASAEGVRIDVPGLLAAAATVSDRHDFLIVEGAGGLMVPIAGGMLIADLAKELGFPLLIVSRCDLGTINHTLLTVFAARAMDLPLAGMVLNGMPAEPDAAQEAAPHSLASLASADLLGVLPRIDGDERTRTTRLAEEIANLPTLSWLLQNLGLADLQR